MWPFSRKPKPEALDAPVTPTPVAPRVPEAPAAPGVTFAENGDIVINVRSSADGKLAIKQLRLRKRELTLIKQSVAAEQHALRAGHADQVARAAPKMRGGGGFGKLVRTVQTNNKASARQSLARELAPHEQQRQAVEQMIGRVDAVILKVEAYLLQQQGDPS